MRLKVQSMIRSRLRRIIRNQSHLVGFVLFHKTQEILGRIAFDVELGVRELVIDQSPDLGKVRMSGVALVRTGMHSQAMRACGQRDAPKTDHARPRKVAAVAEHGNGVEVDREFGGH